MIDNYKGHIDKDIENKLLEFRIDVKKLPPNTTAYLQPLDLTVNAPFKRFYAEKWDEYQFHLDSKPLTKGAQNFPAPSKENKVQWISKAWESVTKEAIINGFKCYLQKQSTENLQEQGNVEPNLELPEDVIKDTKSLKENLDDEDEDDDCSV